MRPGNWFFLFSLFTATLFLTGCQSGSGTKKEPDERPLFTLLAPEKTHVDFANTLTEGLNTNVLMYEYFYNGGGVAVGDLNNDGLQDLYFSANMVSNRLYLNRGKMQFEDITKQSGAAGREGPWKTGVTMADVNGDGLLDIYACYSGKISGDKRVNQLFINQGPDGQGVPHFEEQARQYGLADSSFSNHAVFFDFDRDHDLDLLLLNHNPQRLSNLDDITLVEVLKKPAPQIGVKLFRNDNGHFQEITQKAGLRSTALSYGLGAGVSDVNGDGWPDIYLSNDYLAPDYLYINKGNGTFKDQIAGSLGHTSQFSMGNDISDINNDGLPDITTLDMLPEDNQRQKLLFAPDNYELFDLNLRAGLHHQYMRNMLQVNNGDGTFSEVGQLAGIANTDWSWAPLWADYDNDGWKDLYITNGYVRDYTNMDFLKYMGDYLQQFQGNLRRQNLLDLVYKIPSSHISDYLYRSNGANLSFTDKTTAWGLHRNSNSNGAVYADLDNDGDLDLVVNNINQPAFIYQNEANALPNRHYLAVKLEGAGKNRNGVGAKVTLYSQGQQQYLEQVPSRGFQSSVSPRLHFGVGAAQIIDSIRVVWLGNGQQMLRQVKADQVLTIRENDARPERLPIQPATLFEEVTSPLAFRHQSAPINDFKRQPLLVTPQSFVGPCLAKGDANGDGREDIYVGGGVGQAGALYLSQANGSFRPSPVPAFNADKESNDADAVFFDANGDGAADLYVCSGGYDAYLPDDSRLQDRLYLNDGQGHFTKSPTALPALRTSKSCVRVADANGDGKPDLFVGGRVIPGRYPETPPSFLLINDGRGNFRDQTAQLAPQLQRVGMVTDAAWLDLNGDKRPELIVVGEWMPITVFGQTDGKWTEQTERYFDKTYRGWWNKLLVSDVNGDGQSDLVVGNLGLNSQCKASDQQPAELYYKDFDDNGSVDPVLCFFIQGKTYPYVFRDELLDQISMMRTRFPDYKSYADATMKEVFTAEELKGADRLEANYLKTACFLRKPGGKFVEQSLPIEAQFAPVCALLSLDYNQDGHSDLLLAGNQNQARLHFGKYDANYGLLLQGDGKGNFRAIPQRQSGFRLQGDVRSLLPINQTILVGINQQPLKAYRLRGPSSAPSVVVAKGVRRE